MKKLLTIIFVLLIISGCSIQKKTNSSDEKYMDLIQTLNERASFSSASQSFSINAEVAKINDAYRYYITIDEPKNAMYGIEIIAIEKGVDYSSNMAANVGIFEENEYNMIPFQSRVDKGYVNGLTVSGVSSNSNPTLYVLVEWYSKRQEIHQEFIELTCEYEAE